MPLRACTGFEFGLNDATSLTKGNTGNRLFDIIAGTPTVVAGAARTGSYGLRLNAVGQELGWDTNTFGASQDHGVFNFWFRIPTALPTANRDICEFFTSINDFGLIFQNSDDRLCIEVGGSVSQTGPVIVADTWYHVEIYVKVDAGTVDWWIDGAAQTQVTNAPSGTTLIAAVLGADNTTTASADFDDVLLWTDTTTISGTPFGEHKVLLLSVDPSGTVTASDGGTDFRRFTSNSTIDGAWNATDVRNAVDEVPPTIGSTADGAVQINTDAVNYMEFPMTSYTLQSGEAIAGLRMLACGWATSTTAATIGFRSYNGTTETVLRSVQDTNFDNSTTSPAWCCKMATPADFDTQSELDALAFRVGFSGDAAPDIGIHAIYAELAVKEGAGSTDGVLGAVGPDADAAFTADSPASGTLAGIGPDADAAFTGANLVDGTLGAIGPDADAAFIAEVPPTDGVLGAIGPDPDATFVGEVAATEGVLGAIGPNATALFSASASDASTDGTFAVAGPSAEGVFAAANLIDAALVGVGPSASATFTGDPAKDELHLQPVRLRPDTGKAFRAFPVRWRESA